MNVDTITYASEITDEDVLDSRDLIQLRSNATVALDDGDMELVSFDACEAREIIAAVDAFESLGVADWQYGETFIRDSYFETYAQELAEDCGMVNADAVWPNTCIDWAQAARELRMDYSAVEVNGVTFWARA